MTFTKALRKMKMAVLPVYLKFSDEWTLTIRQFKPTVPQDVRNVELILLCLLTLILVFYNII